MMDSSNRNIETGYCLFSPITEDDVSMIIDIRTNNSQSVLNKISTSRTKQKQYVELYMQRFSENKEIYFKITEKGKTQPSGLIRVTELDEECRFNLQSLIFREKCAPFMPIDAIFTMYEMGFEKLKKEICGPLLVPKEGKKVYQLHKKMDIATEVVGTEKNYYFVATMKKFAERKYFFKNLGFGLV